VWSEAVAEAIKIRESEFTVKTLSGLRACALLLLPAVTLADSPFDGTWKGDLSTATVTAKPDVFLLQDGTYSCKTCTPQ
jgi:hypothetical protein